MRKLRALNPNVVESLSSDRPGDDESDERVTGPGDEEDDSAIGDSSRA